MNNLSAGLSLLLLPVASEKWAAGPSDILDYLKHIANLKFRGSIDLKHHSSGAQYLKAASWSSLGRDCYMDISAGIIIPTNVRSIFQYSTGTFLKFSFHKCPSQKNPFYINMQQGKHKRNHYFSDCLKHSECYS